MRKIILLLVSLMIITSCKSLKLESFNEQNILKEIMNSLQIKCLKENNSFQHKINYYLNFISVFYEKKINTNSLRYKLFYKGLENVLTEKELIEIKENYKKFKDKKWEQKEFSFTGIMIIDENNNDCISAVKISRPLFSLNKKKAIVIVGNSTSINIKILLKVKGNWAIKSNIPTTITH